MSPPATARARSPPPPNIISGSEFLQSGTQLSDWGPRSEERMLLWLKTGTSSSGRAPRRATFGRGRWWAGWGRSRPSGWPRAAPGLPCSGPGEGRGGAQTSDGWSGGPRSSTGELAGQTPRGLPVCLSAAEKFKSWVWCQLLQGAPLAVKSRVKVLKVHRKGKITAGERKANQEEERHFIQGTERSGLSPAQGR